MGRVEGAEALDIAEPVLGGGSFSVEKFVESFPVLVEVAGSGDALRGFIIDLAVRGRLTEARSTDGSATDLLARVSTMRTKQGTVGRALNSEADSSISEGPPFPITPSWCWTNLGDIVVKLGAGSTPLGGKAVYREAGIKFLRSQNVWNDGLRLDAVAFIDPKTHEKMSGTWVEPGDILLNITGASIGRCSVVPDAFDTANVSQHVAIVRLAQKELRRFLHLWICSPSFQKEIMSVQVGVSREGLSMKRLQEFAIPVPPLAEQKRIVARVDQLMALIDQLEAKQNRKRDLGARFTKASLESLTTAESPQALTTAWTRIQENWPCLLDHPDKVGELKRVVLEVAVRGSLVRQMSSDGTGASLMEQVLQERAHLIEGRRMTGRGHDNDAAEAAFTPSHDIPSSWRWCRLEDVAGHIVDGTHHTPTYVNTGVDFISAKDIKNGHIVFEACRQISKEEFADLAKRCRPQRGNILVTKSGSIGDVAIVETDRVFTLFESVALVPLVPSIDPKFASYVIYLEASGQFGDLRRKGMAVQHLHLVDLRSLPFPVPPLAEQKRIVAKVEQLMKLCDDLEAALRRSEDRAAKLAEAVVQEMVA